VAPAESLLRGGGGPPLTGAASWRPEASRSGPVSVVISAADRRVVVLRNGVMIGSAPVRIDGSLARTSAFVMRDGGSWLRIMLPGQTEEGDDLRGRIHVAPEFRREVEAILRPGATVVVSADSLRSGGAGSASAVLEDEPGS
jgi:hypothetical protein